MKATSRRVFVHYLDVDSTRKDAILPSLADLVSIWDRRRLAGRAHIDVGSGDIVVTLGDLRVNAADNTATLLFRHSDKAAAESVYSDIRANRFRANAKAANEGGETGAHLFLSLTHERRFPRRYTCIIEKVPYLDHHMMRRVLNSIIRDEHGEDPASFGYDNPAGQMTRAGLVRRERCLPRIEFEGQPSANLAQDVQDGHLNGVTLIRTEPHVPVGGVPFLTRDEATLKLSVDQGGLAANVWGGVRRALAAESQHFPTASVSITPPGGTRSVSIRVDSATGAPLSDLYTRSHDIIGIAPPMRHSADRVVPQFERMVHPVLLRERQV